MNKAEEILSRCLDKKKIKNFKGKNDVFANTPMFSNDDKKLGRAGKNMKKHLIRVNAKENTGYAKDVVYGASSEEFNEQGKIIGR
jgi:hypothetical protein